MAVTARQFEMTKKLVEMGFDINKPYLKVLQMSLINKVIRGV